MGLGAAHHALPPPILDHAGRDLRALAVEAVEGAGGHVEEELGAVVRGGLAEAVEHLDGQAFRVGRGLQHQRRHGGNQHRLGDAAGGLAMLGHIARDLAAAGGMADMDGILQVEMLDHREGVGGIMVHVVAVADLGGAAVAAPVMGHHAVAVLHEEQHLRVPVVRRQRPAVVEHDRLGVLGTPILVEDLDAVFGGDERHGCGSFDRI